MITQAKLQQQEISNYFRYLDICKDVTLDSNDQLFKITFVGFHVLSNCEVLKCLIANDNFEPSLRVFPNLRKLTWTVNQFQFNSINFESMRHLREFTVEYFNEPNFEVDTEKEFKFPK